MTRVIHNKKFCNAHSRPRSKKQQDKTQKAFDFLITLDIREFLPKKRDDLWNRRWNIPPLAFSVLFLLTFQLFLNLNVSYFSDGDQGILSTASEHQEALLYCADDGALSQFVESPPWRCSNTI